MPRRGKQTTESGAGHVPFPEWEKLTAEQQRVLSDRLQEAAWEIRGQYEEALSRLNQSAAAGSMLARRDASGLAHQPIPPVPDVKRDAAYEKLVLDIHRLGACLSYLEACLAHLSAQGFDLGVGLAEYLSARTEMLPEGRVKAFARVLEEQGRASYTSLYSRVVNTFPERAMQRLLAWGMRHPGTRTPGLRGCAGWWVSPKPSPARKARWVNPAIDQTTRSFPVWGWRVVRFRGCRITRENLSAAPSLLM